MRGEYFGYAVCANCHAFAVMAGLRAGHPRPAAEKKTWMRGTESAHDDLPLINMLSARALSERNFSKTTRGMTNVGAREYRSVSQPTGKRRRQSLGGAGGRLGCPTPAFAKWPSGSA